METFLKAFPSIYVDKTKKAEDQKAVIRIQKMLQIGILEKGHSSLDLLWYYISSSGTVLRREESREVPVVDMNKSIDIDVSDDEIGIVWDAVYREKENRNPSPKKNRIL